jgi:hypothetical protein
MQERNLTASELAAAKAAYIAHAKQLYNVLDEYVPSISPSWLKLTCPRKFKPYAAHLFAHNSSLTIDRDLSTAVQFSGRDRSKAALLAKEKLKAREQARREDSDAEEEFTPRKRASVTPIRPNWLELADIVFIGPLWCQVAWLCP